MPRSRPVLWVVALAWGLAGCRIEFDVFEPELIVGVPDTLPVDIDGDGFAGEDDCDDVDANRFPGAYEDCDGIDNDCNTVIDDEEACAGAERFSQVLEADVLFVIDTAVEMRPFLDDIGDWSYDFASEMAGPGADVNVGLITMDASDPGLVTLGHRAFVSAGAESGVQRVTEWLRLVLEEGQQGDSVPPRGRDAVLQLLGPGAAAKDLSGEAEPWVFADFRRTEVPLALVFVSRDNDQSAASVSHFIETMSDANVRSEMVTHAFVSSGAPCEAGMHPGIGYQRLAQLTDGYIADLCTMSPSDMRVVGERVASSGLIPFHRISDDVDLSKPVSVTIEAIDGTSYSLTPNEFFVDGALRRLVLTPPPAPGSGILFEYQRLPQL